LYKKSKLKNKKKEICQMLIEEIKNIFEYGSIYKPTTVV
jgi:hypothetical protein